MLFCYRGILQQGRKNYDEAILSYQRAIHFRPSLARKSFHYILFLGPRYVIGFITLESFEQLNIWTPLTFIWRIVTSVQRSIVEGSLTSRKIYRSFIRVSGTFAEKWRRTGVTVTHFMWYHRLLNVLLLPAYPRTFIASYVPSLWSIVFRCTIDTPYYHTTISPACFISSAAPSGLRIHPCLLLETEWSVSVLNEPPFTRETPSLYGFRLGGARRTPKRPHRRQKRKKQGKRKMSGSFVTAMSSIRVCRIRDLLRPTWERFVTARDSLSRYNIDFMAPPRAVSSPQMFFLREEQFTP